MEAEWRRLEAERSQGSIKFPRAASLADTPTTAGTPNGDTPNAEAYAGGASSLSKAEAMLNEGPITGWGEALSSEQEQEERASRAASGGGTPSGGQGSPTPLSPGGGSRSPAAGARWDGGSTPKPAAGARWDGGSTPKPAAGARWDGGSTPKPASRSPSRFDGGSSPSGGNPSSQGGVRSPTRVDGGSSPQRRESGSSIPDAGSSPLARKAESAFLRRRALEATSLEATSLEGTSLEGDTAMGGGISLATPREISATATAERGGSQRKMQSGMQSGRGAFARAVDGAEMAGLQVVPLERRQDPHAAEGQAIVLTPLASPQDSWSLEQSSSVKAILQDWGRSVSGVQEGEEEEEEEEEEDMEEEEEVHVPWLRSIGGVRRDRSRSPAILAPLGVVFQGHGGMHPSSIVGTMDHQARKGRETIFSSEVLMLDRERFIGDVDPTQFNPRLEESIRITRRLVEDAAQAERDLVPSQKVVERKQKLSENHTPEQRFAHAVQHAAATLLAGVFAGWRRETREARLSTMMRARSVAGSRAPSHVSVPSTSRTIDGADEPWSASPVALRATDPSRASSRPSSAFTGATPAPSAGCVPDVVAILREASIARHRLPSGNSKRDRRRSLSAPAYPHPFPAEGRDDDDQYSPTREVAAGGGGDAGENSGRAASAALRFPWTGLISVEEAEAILSPAASPLGVLPSSRERTQSLDAPSPKALRESVAARHQVAGRPAAAPLLSL
ncbi:hypothetical protein T484DRAFT_1909484, partial [Baffinella frigidus]